MDAYLFSRKHHETSQFVRHALLKAADGLISTAAVMISVGAFQQDTNIDIILLGVSWMVARNCSMFMSACSQLDKSILDIIETNLTIASLMLGVGAGNESNKAIILSGFAGFVANFCSKVTGDIVTLYTQLDIEVAQTNRDTTENEVSLKNRLVVATTIVLAFSTGAMVSLLTAFCIKEYVVWVKMVVAAVSIGLVLFGSLWAALGVAPILMSAATFLVVGWLLMAITFALTKLIGSSRFITSPEIN